MEYLEYTVFTKADRALAWKIFCDVGCWPSFSNIYGNIRWSRGVPWTAGSRLRIEIVRPVKTVADHVITVCLPEEKVGWIDHVLGNTLQQWVNFDTLADGTTRIHTWLEVIGSTKMVAGRDVDELLRAFIRAWYDNFCATCDKLADESAIYA